MVEKNQLYAKIGEKIREFRQKAELKQENLCKMIGLNRSSMAQIESGKQAVTIFTLYLLAEALQVNVVELLPKEKELNFDRFSRERVEQPEALLEHINRAKDAIDV